MQDSTCVCPFPASCCANLQICKSASLNLHQQTSTRSTAFTIDLAGCHHSPTSLQVLLPPCSASNDAGDRRCPPDAPSGPNCNSVCHHVSDASIRHSTTLALLDIFLLSLGLLCSGRLSTSHAAACCRSTICAPIWSSYAHPSCARSKACCPPLRVAAQSPAKRDRAPGLRNQMLCPRRAVRHAQNRDKGTAVSPK